jgi:hypothetical protein
LSNEEIIALGVLVSVFIFILLMQQSIMGYENVERITWVDWRGRTRAVEIHRRAKWVQ